MRHFTERELRRHVEKKVKTRVDDSTWTALLTRLNELLPRLEPAFDPGDIEQLGEWITQEKREQHASALRMHGISEQYQCVARLAEQHIPSCPERQGIRDRLDIADDLLNTAVFSDMEAVENARDLVQSVLDTHGRTENVGSASALVAHLSTAVGALLTTASDWLDREQSAPAPWTPPRRNPPPTRDLARYLGIATRIPTPEGFDEYRFVRAAPGSRLDWLRHYAQDIADRYHVFAPDVVTAILTGMNVIRMPLAVVVRTPEFVEPSKVVWAPDAEFIFETGPEALEVDARDPIEVDPQDVACAVKVAKLIFTPDRRRQRARTGWPATLAAFVKATPYLSWPDRLRDWNAAHRDHPYISPASLKAAYHQVAAKEHT